MILLQIIIFNIKIFLKLQSINNQIYIKFLYKITIFILILYLHFINHKLYLNGIISYPSIKN